MSDRRSLVEASVGRPDITSSDAERAASELFAVRGSFVELGSQQDRNYRIDGHGAAPLLLKVANPAWSSLALTAQGAALAHLAGAGLDVPRVLAAVDGSPISWLELRGERLALRLLTYLEGTPLRTARYLAPSVVRRLGALAGETSRALADFDHEGLTAPVQWDLQHAETIVARFAVHVHDAKARARVEQVAAAAAARLAPLRGALREQVVHGDLTDDNVVCLRGVDGRLVPYGIIDFGDLMRSWLVAELAITCASALCHMPQRPLGILPAVEAFDELVPLEDAEIAALWPLIALRAASLAVSDSQQLAIDPGNHYTAERAHVGWRTLDGAAGLGFDLAEAALRDALGRPETAAAPVVATTLFPDLARSAPRVVDLSVTSEALDHGRFLEPDCEQALLARAAVDGVAITRYGEHRLTRTQLRSDQEQETFALCVELVSQTDQAVEAPWPATVISAVGSELALTHDGVSLWLSGIASGLVAGATLEPGDTLGTLRAGVRGRVQLCTVPEVAPPSLTTPTAAAAWRRLCPDPSTLLGVECAAPRLDAAAVLARRDSAYAGVQGRYYDAPPQIERGLAEHLIDASGRAYVDMVNNVALLGHAHPRMTRAVTRQWRLLNTNSRFNYEVISEFTTRLAALAPNGLDTVLLVNSGTEATDLALRIAFAHTGREIVIAVGEAYHGWSVAADAVSTSLADNPNALDTRPPWTRFLDSPNSYRGIHRGASAEAYAREAVSRIDQIAASGDHPAALIAEAVYGNAGGVLLPPGYLAAVYERVRAHGGLCIADEVQVGYGRLGKHFFGFEQQGVEPDIITVAKAMGNGHPIGGVITTREIAESLRETGSFFSSAGGSTVSCRAGLAVLDAMRDDGLQANATSVGDHLAARVASLAERHELIGAMHGMGLYAGIELVRHHDTLEPATEEAFAICERMRELGIIVQPTSDRMNVLKVKPPLCITRESCDFFLDQLERTLVEGW
jgi:4-aminobutyrate aminotransferase-like enzyme/Ser/Thr protein kinase RdoA (MazF antagonist)